MYDVVAYRLAGTGDELRWLVMRGDGQLFEPNNEHRAIARACALASEQNVKRFLSDDFGIRKVNCTYYPLRKKRPSSTEAR